MKEYILEQLKCDADLFPSLLGLHLATEVEAGMRFVIISKVVNFVVPASNNENE